MAKSKLKGIGGLWKKAKKETANDSSGEFVPADIGKYKMQLIGISLGKYGGRIQFMRTFVILDEDDRGVVCKDFMKAETADELVWVQRWLIAQNIDVDDIEVETTEDILDVIKEELVDNQACSTVNITEAQGYKNLKVQKRIEVDEDELWSNDEGGSDEDEDEDEDDDEEEGDDDPLDAMSRKELKKYITENDLSVKVKKSMSDDKIRDAINEEEEED